MAPKRNATDEPPLATVFARRSKTSRAATQQLATTSLPATTSNRSVITAPPAPPPPAADLPPAAEEDAQLVFREQLRQTLDVDPKYLSLLTTRGEIGYWRASDRKVLANRVLTLDCTEFRRTIGATLTSALRIVYYQQGSMRQADIDAEIAAFVPLAVDVCMTALYAKLRNIHRSHNVHPTRYTTAPSYAKDVELPLPFALAIQELGVFETNSLTANVLCIPTFPEGTQHEGRAAAANHITRYLSYLPTLRELGLPLKTIDVHLKKGSPWWTYKLSVQDNTVDLVCTIPPSLYTDFSAQLRMLFIVPTAADAFDAAELVEHDAAIPHFGVRAKELRRGINYRAFLALCHSPSECWTFS